MPTTKLPAITAFELVVSTTNTSPPSPFLRTSNASVPVASIIVLLDTTDVKLILTSPPTPSDPVTVRSPSTVPPVDKLAATDLPRTIYSIT